MSVKVSIHQRERLSSHTNEAYGVGIPAELAKNWQKLNQKIAKGHEHISNSRKDYHFKVAHYLCDRAGIVFAENLNAEGLAKGMLSKHTLDAGFGQFINILSWVCWKRGVYFQKVNARGTSQTCPQCGTHAPKDLSIRVHECFACGYKTDRDIAAAQVILKRGFETLSAAGLAVEKVACGGGLSGTEVFSLDQSLRDRKPKSRGFGILCIA